MVCEVLSIACDNTQNLVKPRTVVHVKSGWEGCALTDVTALIKHNSQRNTNCRKESSSIKWYWVSFYMSTSIWMSYLSSMIRARYKFYFEDGAHSVRQAS